MYPGLGHETQEPCNRKFQKESLNERHFEKYEDLGVMKQTVFQKIVTSETSLKKSSRVTKIVVDPATDETLVYIAEVYDFTHKITFEMENYFKEDGNSSLKNMEKTNGAKSLESQILSSVKC